MPLKKAVLEAIKRRLTTVQEADNIRIEFTDLECETMKASFTGPPDTPYENEEIYLKVSFSNDYPFKPPRVSCATKVWHPNINLDSGGICLDILRSTYSPHYKMLDIFESIMLLLAYPNTSDPVNRNAALQYDENRKEFNTEVKKWMSLRLPTSDRDSNMYINTSDISTRLALAWCVWNAGRKGIGAMDRVQWDLEEVMVAILNIHRDTIGRFPEEFDNLSILLKDKNKRSTHRKVTLHIDQCQYSADWQNNECVLVYTLPIGERHVAYITNQEGKFYNCIDTLVMGNTDCLKIPIEKEGNILYNVSITSTKYDINSTKDEMGRENEYLDDHWNLFWMIAPKQESELEEFCQSMHLLGYYQTCMRRWDMAKFAFNDKLIELFYRWRRVLRDTTFGFNDGFKLISFMKERLASQHQAQSQPESSQQAGSSRDSCPAKRPDTFRSPPPTQEEDQGQTSTCTRYALTKCVFNSIKRRTEQEQMPLVSQSLISTAILNILPDCHGSWPEEFDDQLFLTMEEYRKGVITSVNKFAMRIQLCKCAYYKTDREYILVYVDKTEGLHTVYVEGKEENSWKCQNSWGNHDTTVYISTDAPGNQLYEVNVENVDRFKKSFYLKERLGPKALKMFLDNVKESIEPKNKEGLQKYCQDMGSFYRKFEPRWERDDLAWDIRLEEVFEHLWREKYEYFMVQLLSSFKHRAANHENEVKPVVETAKPAEEGDDGHEVKNAEYGENDARFSAGTDNKSDSKLATEEIGLEKAMSESSIDKADVVEVDTPSSRVDTSDTKVDADELGSNASKNDLITAEQRGDPSQPKFETETDAPVQLSQRNFLERCCCVLF